MKKTIAQRIIEEMQDRGYTYLGMTTGQCSTRKGSNLYRALVRLDALNEPGIQVRRAAKLQRATQGTQLLIFRPADWRKIAQARVTITPALKNHEYILMEYDWPDSDHFKDVATMPLIDLIEWIESVESEE